VLLVDENDDFLDGLTAWLLKTPGLEVVGRAHSGREAMVRIEASSPHLVIMDASLTDVSGFEVTRRIKSRPPAPVVVLTTFHESRAASSAALEAGADLCVSKTEITHRLLPAIADLMELGKEPGREGREGKDAG
jgi:DNA-binding NarL/FixJ family response regulator